MSSSLVLGDALEVLMDHRGKTPKKLGSEFVESGVPVVSAILVKDGRLDLAGARFVDEATCQRWMSVPTRKGDVLLTSEAPLGRVARVETDAPLVLGQRLFGLRGRQGVLDSGYLYYALQSSAVQGDLLGRATGTTVTGIRQSALRQVRIPDPGYEQQLAISSVLGALDSKIAGNLRAVMVADALAEAVLASAVREDVALSDVADVTMGSSPPGTSYNDTGDGVPFFQGVRDFGLRTPSRRVFTSAPTRMAEAEDTLVSVRAPVGRTNLAREQLCLGRGLAGLRSRRATPMTLFHQVRAAKAAWEPYEAEGTVFGAINKAQIATIRVPSVPMDSSDAVEAGLRALEDWIYAALKECEALAALRDELLLHFMSGQLQVRDVPHRQAAGRLLTTDRGTSASW